MKVFKFGGASVKDASAVKNAGEILKQFEGEKLVVVISAMGKTTNGLEKVVNACYNKTNDALLILEEIKSFHEKIMGELFENDKHEVYQKVNNLFVEIEWVIEDEPRGYDFIYDQIVSFGELISTTIVSAWLNENGISNNWLDIRDCLLTDNNYREAKVDWKQSEQLFNEKIPSLFASHPIVITQGFIGNTSENFTTTLGREGSDYTAAIIAHIMNAESVTIWKDVPGVLNADPKFFNDAQKLEQLSYLDAIELAYYGASVIHPKTIKPLENKNIPLHVRSFLQPTAKGTTIGKDLQTKPLVPSFIFKTNQVLISISAKDFSFIAEENLSAIFGTLAEIGIKLNLMQNSAISFSVCIDDDQFKVPKLIERLKEDYRVRYNSDLQLYTIRHYYPSTIETLSTGRDILLEQRSRNTAQLVMKAEEKK
ncbi:MAG TPA: aspartate kinase [Bacteroidia bacterium]|jgi:aspartate kinase|nr:aspartate kinase [Bacteroidia bacterium]HQF28170.1 aspartate kinase [Bacteroidia bacterium]